jgi:hypothetical protein
MFGPRVSCDKHIMVASCTRLMYCIRSKLGNVRGSLHAGNGVLTERYDGLTLLFEVQTV